MDILTVFCQIDYFCNEFEPRFNQMLLTDGLRQRNKPNARRLSEVMTIHVSVVGLSEFEDFLQGLCLSVLESGVSASLELQPLCRTSTQGVREKSKSFGSYPLLLPFYFENFALKIFTFDSDFANSVLCYRLSGLCRCG